MPLVAYSESTESTQTETFSDLASASTKNKDSTVPEENISPVNTDILRNGLDSSVDQNSQNQSTVSESKTQEEGSTVDSGATFNSSKFHKPGDGSATSDFTFNSSVNFGLKEASQSGNSSSVPSPKGDE